MRNTNEFAMRHGGVARNKKRKGVVGFCFGLDNVLFENNLLENLSS